MGAMTYTIGCHAQSSVNSVNTGQSYNAFYGGGNNSFSGWESGNGGKSWGTWGTYALSDLGDDWTIFEAYWQVWTSGGAGTYTRWGWNDNAMAGEGNDTYNNTFVSPAWSEQGNGGATGYVAGASYWNFGITSFVSDRRYWRGFHPALNTWKWDTNHAWYQYSRTNGSWYSRVYAIYGVPLTGLSVTAGVRSISSSWNATSGADRYSVYLDGAYQGQTTSTSWGNSNIGSGSHTIAIYPYYDSRGTSSGQSGSATTTTGSVPAPGAAGDTQTDNTFRRKYVRIDPEPQYYSSDLMEIEIAGTVGGTGYNDTFTTANDTVMNRSKETWPAGTYNVRQRAYWNNGDRSAWSSTVAITITQPSVGTITPTTAEYRKIVPNWSRSGALDATHWDVSIDGTTAIRIPNTVGTHTGTDYSALIDSERVTFTRSNLMKGNHTVLVTPVYTSGYTGSVTASAVTSNTVVLPSTPAGTTATADSPLKRQLVVNLPQQASTFYGASGWEVRRSIGGSNAATITSSASATSVTFSNVPAGPQTVEIRPRWADGDGGAEAFTVLAGTYTTTSPAPTSAISRQRSTLNTYPTLTSPTTASTLAAGTYYIATSVNKAGVRLFDAAHPYPTRPYNESTPTAINPNETTNLLGGRVVIGTSNTNTIVVTKPTNCTGTDTWNVYIGTGVNSLSEGRNGGTILKELASGTATATITTYVDDNGGVPTVTKAKVGKVDFTWVAPTGVGDAPTSYLIERASSSTPNAPGGIPTTYTDVQTKITAGKAGVYSTVKYWEDGLDSKYYFYRIKAVYNNAVGGSGDYSPEIELVV